MENSITSLQQWDLLKKFLTAVRDDPRIGVFHISIYVCLLQQWEITSFRNPVEVFAREIMPAAKISSPATYHKCIRALHAYGYIHYEPSYSHNERSRVFLLIKSEISTYFNIGR